MLRHEDNLVSRLSGNTLQPLAGISVTVTDNVTGLPASLYSDNGVTPITQAIVTDNDGYFGFYAPDGSYTLTFTGVRVAPFTRQIVLDDPKDNPYATKAELAAGSGSSNVTFTQAGAGAVPRPLQDELRGTINVVQFGADPTGVTDSSAAIQSAIAHARQKSGNIGALDKNAKSAVILFPPGEYKVAQKVLLAPNMILRGDGATIMCRDDGVTFETGYYLNGVLTSNMGLDDVTVTYFGLTGLRFENLTFFGGDMPLNLRCAIWQSGIFNCQFYNCHIAFTLTQCFYFTLDDFTVRGQHASFPPTYGVRLLRGSNAISMNNFKINNRTSGMLIGEPGDANISGSLNLTNGRLESMTYGVELSGGFFNLHISDVYAESVDSLFYDSDGAIKYNVKIEDVYSNGTSFYVDLSGLRDSHIGMIRDHSGLANVKAVTRLRQGTNGNKATVELSNLADTGTGTSRYLLSDGVRTVGVLSKATSGPTPVYKNQTAISNVSVSQYASQPAIYDTGWYGEAPGYIIGAINGALTPVNGTEPYIATQFWFSEYTALNYAVKITPNAGSGSGGTTPAPILLKGIVIGRDATQIVPNSLVAFGFPNGAAGTINIGFGEFGVNSTDPAFAWMRNGQFAAEGIVKLIA